MKSHVENINCIQRKEFGGNTDTMFLPVKYAKDKIR